MTTATMTGAEFQVPDRTEHDTSGAHGWSVRVIEAPVTSYSLTPEQTDTTGPATLTRDVDEHQTGVPSLMLN